MKIRVIIFGAIVLFSFVQDGDCGIVSDMYGNVRNKTIAVKDGVTSWLSYGKDLVLGNEKVNVQEKSKAGREIVQNDNLISRIFNRLLDGFTSTRDKVYGFFISDDTKDNSFIKNMYEKVKKKLTMIIALDDDEPKKLKSDDDLKEIRQALNTLINNNKKKQEEQIHAGVNALKDTVHNVEGKVQASVDVVKEKVDHMKGWAGAKIAENTNSATDTITKEVNNAREGLSDTLAGWKKSGVEISEKEREVLSAISNRIRNRISDYDYEKVINNLQPLAYGEAGTSLYE